jgi:hypothetical protein
MTSGTVGFGDYYMNKALIEWKGSEYEYGRNLGLLRIINFASNKLTGEIPEEITPILEVIVLNLSRNNLAGVMPEKTGQLKQLPTLDFSENRLSGRIPTWPIITCPGEFRQAPNSGALMLRLLMITLHFVGPQSPKNVLEMIHLEFYQLMMAAKKMLMNSRNGFRICCMLVGGLQFFTAKAFLGTRLFPIPGQIMELAQRV